jgi:hypothetical protein
MVELSATEHADRIRCLVQAFNTKVYAAQTELSAAWMELWEAVEKAKQAGVHCRFDGAVRISDYVEWTASHKMELMGNREGVRHLEKIPDPDPYVLTKL